jgi:hypothetical protein
VISIEQIEIREFRGIRNLRLDFRGKSFAICGPNGTGKSGVVDAIEFALTGNISRLSGEGRGEVSVRQHGPHVDQRDNPEKANVKLSISIPALEKSATIERSVKAPNSPQISPRDPDVIKILKNAENHPEVVLSRRELIRYVIATPGDRAQEVQALLHLEQIEKVRSGLQRIANACERPLRSLQLVAREAGARLLAALGINELSAAKLLEAANAQRAILKLPALPSLSDKTSLIDGLAAAPSGQPQQIPKLQALEDLKTARQALEELAGPNVRDVVVGVVDELRRLSADTSLAESVRRELFLSTGIALATDALCPFCDAPWDIDNLRAHVQKKVAHLSELTTRRKAVEKRIALVVEVLRRSHSALEVLERHAKLLKPPIPLESTTGFIANCKTSIARLGTLLPLERTTEILESIQLVPAAVAAETENLTKSIHLLPDPSKQDAARELLTRAEERLLTYRDAMRKWKSAREEAQVSRKVSDIYSAASDRVLTGIYSAVQQHFSDLYSFVNKPDEKDFKAKLEPSLGKLGFDVDFYGRGFFPPGAYHSEGHQDGMGLCLYLALMRYVLGKGFTFAVLDDVLMSVDAGHRREVCALLRKEFPDTQFIVTTHDPIWLRHMETESLTTAESSVQFRTWSVEEGPTDWTSRDCWGEIEAHLRKNDVRAAAAHLRHYLEYIASELCHRLGASVAFRGDAQYSLGELLPAAIARMRRLYGKGKASANSWNRRDRVELLAMRGNAFDEVAATTRAEEWQVNAAVHYNAWANFHPKDFAPVAKAFQNLVSAFTCGDCGEYFRVAPYRGTPESVRCRCGEQFNLLDK